MVDDDGKVFSTWFPVLVLLFFHGRSCKIPTRLVESQLFCYYRLEFIV